MKELDIHFYLDWFWFKQEDLIYYSQDKDQLELFRERKSLPIDSWRDRMMFQETYCDEIIRSKLDEKYKLLAIETIAEGTILFSLKNELT